MATGFPYERSVTELIDDIIVTVRSLWGRHAEIWLATTLFVALTFVLTYPISTHPGSVSLGNDPDVHTFTWTLAWDAHAFVHKPWAIFNANIFFPYDRTLAFSENLIGSAFIAAPILWVTGNPVLAMNAVALLSVALCGIGAYVLARGIGLSPTAAVICGIIFAFSPARFFRFPQLHLTAIQWIPFTLASLQAYFDHGRKRDLRIAIGLFTLQALTSLHGGVYLLLAVIAFLVHRIVLGTPIAFMQRLRDIGVLGALLCVPALLLVPPYLRVQKEMGLVRTLENWIASRESFLASPTHAHAWLLARMSDIPVNERASAFLFPGYLALMLAAIALFTIGARAHRRDVVLYLLIAVIGLVLAAGPPLSVWPYVYWLPGLNFIRIPSRFFLLTVLAIAVLAALGFERLTALRSFRTRLGLTCIACALLVAEFATVPLPVVPYTVEFASVDRWLAGQPKPFAVAEVPVGPTMRYHSTYMLHSMAHWQKTVHGHSSLLAPFHERLYEQLRSFPDEVSVRSLSEFGVNYVVVHIDMYQPGEWAAVESRLTRFDRSLALVHQDDSGRVYSLARQ